MNHDEPNTGAYRAGVEARRAEFERQLRDDTLLNQPHGAEVEPHGWAVRQWGVVLFYLVLMVAAGVGVGRI